MKLTGGVEWALHCAWLLAFAPPETALPTRRLAEFYDLPEAYLAKVLKALERGGVLVATSGPRGGFRLASAPGAITVADVVAAVSGPEPIWHCTEIRQRGPVPLSAAECRRICGISQVMQRAEQAWWDDLAATSVADLVDSSGPGARARATSWIEGWAPASSRTERLKVTSTGGDDDDNR